MSKVTDYLNQYFMTPPKDYKPSESVSIAIYLFTYWLKELSLRIKEVPPLVKLHFGLLPNNDRGHTTYFLYEDICLVGLDTRAMEDCHAERTIVHEVSHVLHFRRCTRMNITLTKKNKHTRAWKRIFKSSGMDVNYPYLHEA